MSADGFKRRLRGFGAPAEGIRSLHDAPTAQHVRYLDLMHRSQDRPDAVVEVEGEPIAYAIDAVGPAPPDIPSLQRSLVFRGDAPYMVVLKPGLLTVYSLGPEILSEEQPQPKLQVHHADAQARVTFQRLFHVEDAVAGTMASDAVHERLFELLSETVDELVQLSLSRGDALSLSGRAMFTRFLVDRSILKEPQWRDVAARAKRPEEFFANATNAAATCRWLDVTFNGDFLPLTFPARKAEFSQFPERVFQCLSDIMHRRRGRQLLFEWADVDMSSVPAGLLSQVYEHQAERWNPYSRKKHGVYYTPRRIADYMVSEVMASVRAERENDADSVRVLDPAVGGGVFLVAFFRELVAERWRRLGRPLNSAELRSILYHQLAGFDISEPALRLTALSLYLTALELDPNPQPLSALGFKPLRGQVLFDVKERQAVEGGTVLGSLRELRIHRHKYDVVIANPPWTALTGSVPQTIEREVNKVIKRERPDLPRVRLPDKVPDLAFLWCASGWAKPDGWITMAMHGRLLFKQSDRGTQARNAIFGAFEITGIVNGAELRSTNVWPHMVAPFCLLFARNRLPRPNGGFYFVSPVLERRINGQGRFRIDPEAAQPISQGQVALQPTLMKTLYRGTALDVGLLAEIHGSIHSRLNSYWIEKLNLPTGQGYKRHGKGMFDATALHKLKDLGSQELPEIVVNVGQLPEFSDAELHRVRDRCIYSGPVVLLRKSPPSPDRRDVSRASAISFTDIAYSESFYGWSTAGHPAADDLAKYLLLLLNSDLFAWYSLITSGEFGVERESIHKNDADCFPVRPLESLGEVDLQHLRTAFDEYCQQPKSEEVVNDFVARVYGLTRSQREVVSDTLATRLPYGSNIATAGDPPDDDVVELFRERLQELLRRSVLGHLFVHLTARDPALPWRFMAVSTSAEAPPLDERVLSHLQLANTTGASRVLVHLKDPQVLWNCTLDQRRYWTKSRARLEALRLLREHYDLWT